MRRRKHYFNALPGDPAPVTAEVKRKLRFSEVDALAIAWHGRYLQFFEDAHTELMRKVGLTYENYGRSDVGAPIVQCHVDYYIPLMLDEEFTVRASLCWSDGARLNVEYLILNEKGETAATGYTVQMFFHVRTHEPYWLTPPLFEACRERWRKGEFDA